MFDCISEKVKKDFISSQIKMINNEYKYSKLSDLQLWQLENIKSLLLAGFSKTEIEKNELYNFTQYGINLIIKIKIFDNKIDLQKELKKNE